MVDAGSEPTYAEKIESPPPPPPPGPNPYFFTTFSKFLSLFFPHFSINVHLKAWSYDISTGPNNSRDISNIFLERGFIYMKMMGFALLILSHFS